MKSLFPTYGLAITLIIVFYFQPETLRGTETAWTNCLKLGDIARVHLGEPMKNLRTALNEILEERPERNGNYIVHEALTSLIEGYEAWEYKNCAGLSYLGIKPTSLSLRGVGADCQLFSLHIRYTEDLVNGPGISPTDLENQGKQRFEQLKTKLEALLGKPNYGDTIWLKENVIVFLDPREVVLVERALYTQLLDKLDEHKPPLLSEAGILEVGSRLKKEFDIGGYFDMKAFEERVSRSHAKTQFGGTDILESYFWFGRQKEGKLWRVVFINADFSRNRGRLDWRGVVQGGGLDALP